MLFHLNPSHPNFLFVTKDSKPYKNMQPRYAQIKLMLKEMIVIMTEGELN